MNVSKCFQHHFILIEQLPNELSLETFDYLNGVDIAYAISQLNDRFQHLLIKYVNTFDFKSINKVKFDYVTQHSSNDINQAVASFSTPFYLVEKRGFTRCDSNNRYSALGIFYTLPFAFEEMRLDMNSCEMSTSTLVSSNIDQKKYESCKKVESLVFYEQYEIPCQSFLTFNIVRL
ncbi:unnamed protein product [Rotaria sp. Silwood2]|nr:unnamed protein product [Rotaria sp. Silwood2]